MASFIPVPEDELNDTTERLANMHNDKDRLRLLKMTARSFSTTAEQMAKLVFPFQSAESKIEAIALLFPAMVDKEKLSPNDFGLKFKEDLDDLNAKIAGLNLEGEAAVPTPSPAAPPPPSTVEIIAGESTLIHADPKFLERKKKDDEARLENYAQLKGVREGLRVNHDVTTSADNFFETRVEKAAAATANISTGLTKVERYDALTDGEFGEIFHLQRGEFEQLPKWKQQQKRKEADLF